jgi:hypothetical protein
VKRAQIAEGLARAQRVSRQAGSAGSVVDLRREPR